MPTLPLSARFLCALAVFQLCAFLFAPGSRAQLSQNSGINSSDTWVTVDLTVTTSGTGHASAGGVQSGYWDLV